MKHGIYIIRDTLTDGSEAFGARLCSNWRNVDLNCVSEHHANSLASALNDALVSHGSDGSIRANEVLKTAGWEE